MAAVGLGQATEVTAYDIETVQTIVAESTKNVSIAMMTALMGGLQEQLSFAQLAQKHINPMLDKELEGSDEKTKRVYQKLFAASKEHIETFSAQFLGATLQAITADTHNPDASRKFLGSFVYTETKNMMEQLNTRARGAIEDARIWA